MPWEALKSLSGERHDQFVEKRHWFVRQWRATKWDWRPISGEKVPVSQGSEYGTTVEMVAMKKMFLQ